VSNTIMNTSEHEPLTLDDAKLQLRGLMQGEPDLVANCANFTALLAAQYADINWLGVYLLRGDELVLGPFQGLPACVRIPLGKGVCGVAAVENRTLAVPDVHAFPGHIACDIRSRSELVVPLRQDGRVVGVLDIDSPRTDRFRDADVEYAEVMAAEFCRLQFA
jgi:GAF domain-containing protein